MVRIIVIGCGHWGPNHVRVFSQLGTSRVVACADPDPRRLDAVRAMQPHVQPFKDYRQMLQEVDCDAVVVAAPTKTHYEIVRDALTAGRHVLCEKPLCTDARQADELVALAASRSLVLMVGHVFLFNPGVIKLKELLQFGDAGRLYYLRAVRTNLGPIRDDVNSVFDLASHDVAIFNFLLAAMPVSVSASGGVFLQPNIEDVAFISLRYPNNVLANIQVSWLDPKKLREIVVVGEKKMLVWDELSSPGPILIYDKGVAREPYYDDYGHFHLLAREGDITIPKINLEEPLKVQNRYFLQCLEQRATKMSDGDFGRGVVHVLEAISRSMKEGGAAVAIGQ